MLHPLWTVAAVDAVAIAGAGWCALMLRRVARLARVRVDDARRRQPGLGEETNRGHCN